MAEANGETSMEVLEGCRMPVKMSGSDEWPLAEILSKKELPSGSTHYYVHYIDFNKRLDEWVEEERLDLNRLQMPKKEDTKKIIKELVQGLVHLTGNW